VADYQAVFAVGDAIVSYLNTAYINAGITFPCKFALVSSADMSSPDSITKLDKQLAFYLHRITTSEHYRNVTRLPDAPATEPVLYLDLHYLLSYWNSDADGAEAEQKVLTWTMQQLQSNPIMDTSILALSSSAPNWAATDTVQLVPADLSMQDLMDIWTGLGPKYRLSVSYIVRVVRVDQTLTPSMPVVATQFNLQPAPSAGGAA
jgi:hypothetical protein